jgi:hypothetical protein
MSINLCIIGTPASLFVCRLVPKDGPEFEVVADSSQLKPKDDDKAESSATNGINYFAAYVSIMLIFFHQIMLLCLHKN